MIVYVKSDITLEDIQSTKWKFAVVFAAVNVSNVIYN